MVELKKTDAADSEFVRLVEKLDAYLTITDEDEHDFYDQYNKLDDIKYVVVAYDSSAPVGCGAIKEYDEKTMEVKRMFVEVDSRGRGLATTLLHYLEDWARKLGYDRCILETGKRQKEAVKLYHKCGYKVIANYGQYQGVANSICFEKTL